MELSISNRTVGIIGLSLSGTLLFTATWRTCFHFWRWVRYAEGYSVDALTPRRAFHALLMLAMTVETIAYADLAGLVPLSQDESMADKLGYVLLEVFGRSIFEYLAFSIVTVMWFKTAIEARFANRDDMSQLLTSLPKILLSWACLLVGTSLLQALEILISAGTLDPDGLYRGSAWTLRAHLLIEGLSWGFHAILAVLCVAITAKRIMYLSTWPQSGTMTRLKIMTKALLPMFLCALCYTTRCLWLIAQFIQMPTAPTHSANRSHPGWWIGFMWIPTLLPSAMLLYSARKRDPMPAIGNESFSSPLLPTPVPPAEAFISFQRFSEYGVDSSSTFTRMDYDDDDDDTVDAQGRDAGSIRLSSLEESMPTPNVESSVHADHTAL